MHARFTRLAGSPDKVEAAIASFAGSIAPALRKLSGAAGVSLLMRHETGEALVVSYWRDEAALLASEDAVAPLRQQLAADLDATVRSAERYEAVVQHRAQPPRAGTWARVSTLRGDRDRVEDGIRNFQSEVIPGLKAQPGFRAALLFVNRAEGGLLAGTIWDDRHALEASAAAADSLRANAAAAAGGGADAIVSVETFEIAFTEVLATVTA